jgi:hypothetical protein
MEKTYPSTDYFFEAPAPVLGAADTAGGQPKRCTFSGVAYSGDAVSDWGEPLVIDLCSVILPDQCPVLLEHSRNKRLGVRTLAVRDGALTCDGYLLANDEARALAAEADEGFPWQLSVHAQAGAREFVAPGVQDNVNGCALTGPMNILRQTAIRELSFTPTGVDGATSARV